MPALFVSDLPAVSPPTLAPAVMRAGVLFGTAPADCLQPDWREHDINCEMARGVFEDIFANEWDDNGRGEHEDRFVRVGMVENACCSSLTPFEGEDSDHLGETGGTAEPRGTSEAMVRCKNCRL